MSTATTTDRDSLRVLRTNMIKTLQGILYDLKHWKELPPTKSKQSAGATLGYVFTRNGRFTYLLLWMTTFTIFIITLMVVSTSFRPRRMVYPSSPYWA